MASFACGTRDEPYMPPPGQTPCCWNAACHGGTRNIYKLKATSCGLFASGNCVPEFTSGMGWSFRLRSRWETPSHSKGKFRDIASATPPIRKAHPTLDTFGYGIISHLLGLGSATWRPPGSALLHESHRAVRKEARVCLASVLHLTIHPANARDCIIQNRLIVRMMENVAPDACHGARQC